MKKNGKQCPHARRHYQIEGSKSTEVVLLDQLVTIDYKARNWTYVETVDNNFLDELLKKVVVIFQNNG